MNCVEIIKGREDGSYPLDRNIKTINILKDGSVHTVFLILSSRKYSPLLVIEFDTKTENFSTYGVRNVTEVMKHYYKVEMEYLSNQYFAAIEISYPNGSPKFSFFLNLGNPNTPISNEELSKDFIIDMIRIENTNTLACIFQKAADTKPGEKNDQNDNNWKNIHERYLCVYDLEENKIKNSILLPGNFKALRGSVRWKEIEICQENGYLFILHLDNLLIYDCQNMFQLSYCTTTSIFKPTSKYNIVTESFFLPIRCPSQSSFLIAKTKKEGKVILEFNNNNKNKKLTIHKITEFFPLGIPTRCLLDIIFIPERNIGLFYYIGKETDEPYLKVYDLLQKTVIRSFTKPILPKFDDLLRNETFAHFFDFGIEYEEELMISTRCNNNIRFFGFLNKEELEHYKDRVSFLFENLNNNNNNNENSEFINYMFSITSKEINFNENIEKKELFYKLILGRHVWNNSNLDILTVENICHFFEKINQKELCFLLCKEYYYYHLKKIRNYNEGLEITKIDNFQDVLNYSSLERNININDNNKKKNEVNNLLIVYKNCIAKYENNDKNKPSSQYNNILTLLCFNLIWKYFYFYPSLFHDQLEQQEKSIFEHIRNHKIIIRLGNFLRKNPEEEEEEGEEEIKENNNNNNSFYEFYRNKLKFLYETKKGSNIVLESFTKINEFNFNNNNQNKKKEEEEEEKKINEIKCHKEILIFKSNFFKSMLRFPGKESLEEQEKGSMKILLLNFEQLKKYIQFIYLGNILVNEEEEETLFGDFMKLINHAEMFGEHKLFEFCAEKLRNISKKLSKIIIEEEEENENDSDDYYDSDDESDDENTELKRQLKLTGCYLENEKIVWNVIVNCFWEFLSKEEIAKIINVSRSEAGLEELDFDSFLMFPE